MRKLGSRVNILGVDSIYKVKGLRYQRNLRRFIIIFMYKFLRYTDTTSARRKQSMGFIKIMGCKLLKSIV